MNPPADQTQAPRHQTPMLEKPSRSDCSVPLVQAVISNAILRAKKLFGNSSFLRTAGVAFLAAAFFLWIAPWRFYECGPDEGMEFSKMLLMLRQPAAAATAWNDQPWFYSQLFGLTFKATGFQFWIPRLATLAVVCGLTLSLPRLMPVGAGWPHWICGYLFFWAWPEVPHLSIAAMVELPAFGLAVISAAILPRSRREWRPRRFIASAILLAIAVQAKLTAALVFPALAAMIVRSWWIEISVGRAHEMDRSYGFEKGLCWTPIVGVAAFAAVFGLIIWWSPAWDWGLLWGSHRSAGLTRQAAGFPFKPLELLKSPGVLTAAIVGLALLRRQRRLGEAMFALVLLSTVLIIHLTHRPWWYYYTVHFGIPLAILGGWGAGELLRTAIRKLPLSSSAGPRGFERQAAMMVGALALSLWAGFELPKAYDEFARVKRLRFTLDQEAIGVLREYAKEANWIFTRENNLAVHAGCMLPPELTILSKKRFWSAHVNEEFVLSTVKRYECDVLVLLPAVELKHEAWIQLVQEGYVKVWSDAQRSIFVSSRLNPGAANPRGALFERLTL